MTDSATHTVLDDLTVQYGRARPREFAADLCAGSVEERNEVLEALPTGIRLPIVNDLPPTAALEFLDGQADERIAGWLAETSPEEALHLFLRLPSERRTAVLGRVHDQDLADRLHRVASFAGETVGAIAELDVVWVSLNDRVEDAVALLRAHPVQAGEPVVVVDTEHRVVGFLDATRALQLDAGATLEKCVGRVVGLRAETAISAAVDAPGWDNHRWLPVIDRDGCLIGLLSRDRLMGDGGSTTARRSPPGLLYDLVRSFVRVSGDLLNTLFGPRSAP